MVYNTRASRLLKYHGSMLADHPRIEAYRRAMEQTITPGDTVVEVGCGTGILSFLAAKLGAKKVYAIEVAEIIDIARMLRGANQLTDKVELIQQLSHIVRLPEKADVLITETIGDFGLDEGILGTVLDARTRFLKPGGKMMPNWIELYSAPIESPRLHAHVGAFAPDLFGFDFSSMRPQVARLMFQERIGAELLTAEPALLGRVDLRNASTADFRSRVRFTALRKCSVHGIAGWFRAEIAEGVELGNAPSEPVGPGSSWKQLFLPAEAPIEVELGATLELELQVRENGAVWTWSLVVLH